jgi:hypothetical protein
MSSINLGEHQGDGIRYSMHISAPAGGLGQMIRNPEGNWVGYAEYAALQAEVEKLKTERDHYQWASTNDGIACNERARENQDLENQIDALKAEVDSIRHTAFSIGLLQDKLRQKCEDYHHAMISNQNNVMLLKKSMSENERLRKAGDGLFGIAYNAGPAEGRVEKLDAWRAAKDTQP